MYIYIQDVANGFDSQSDHSTHSSASKEMTSVPRQATFELETSDQQDPELSLELEFNPTPHTEEAEENSIASQGSSTVVVSEHVTIAWMSCDCCVIM